MQKYLKDGRTIADLVMVDEGLTYVKDGKIIYTDPAKQCMVQSSSDLDLLTDLPPGSIAFTAGYNDIWQKTSANEWVTV